VDLFDVAVDIRVLECLEGRECRLGVEVCDGVCERGGVDVRLGKEVVSINVLSTQSLWYCCYVMLTPGHSRHHSQADV
jgi:hypothetical protein